MTLKVAAGVIAGMLAGCRSRSPAGHMETVAVHVDEPGPTLSPTLHGVFFEDINYGADGGL
jgi:hypothetical protein